MKANDPLSPTIFIIFGGAGDLSWRKLVPALFELFLDSRLPDKFLIIGVDRADHTDKEFRKHLHDGVTQFSNRGKISAKQWAQFAKLVTYLQGDFFKQETYSRISKKCLATENEWKEETQRIFYMATPPSMFSVIPQHLGQENLSKSHKIVVEKPIGSSLETARELNAVLATHFDESQIYRIDHYLGKETVQNILALRFANPMFEPFWNRSYVDYVTISVAEEVGVEHRGGYYEHAGALRDMVQNHLLQLLCLVAMEPMISFNADEIRNKKVDVLHAIRPIVFDTLHHHAMRGQYGEGWVRGKKVPGYRQEEGVSPTSRTETFAALTLFVDNWRWQGVPFYLRTGKRLGRQFSQIVIHFKNVPYQAFPPEAIVDWQSTNLVIAIQPDEGIHLNFQAKYPGPKMHLRPVDMHFCYGEAFQTRTPDAYETLLWDVMRNDATLFMRQDQVEAAWTIIKPVLEVWENSVPNDFPNYAAGGIGPVALQHLGIVIK